MFSDGNHRLQQMRTLVKGLISDVDSLLADVREIRLHNFSRDSSSGEPGYVRSLSQKRDTLAQVAELLADMRLEWSQGMPGDGDGRGDRGEERGAFPA